MKVIPFILAFLAVGLVAYVFVADRMYQVFDSPEREQDVVVLTVDTMMLDESRRDHWLPISSLTKDQQGNWAIYSVKAEDDNRERVVRHQVGLKRIRQERALVSVPEKLIKEKIIHKGLHLIVPGQLVRSEKPLSEGPK